MEKLESNLRDILGQLNNDTKIKRIVWTIYMPSKETMCFVARKKAKKRKKGSIIAEIEKQRTENGTYVIIYVDGYGFFWKYSLFKNLERTIVDSSPAILKNEHRIVNKRIVNSIEDIAVMLTTEQPTQKKESSIHKKTEVRDISTQTINKEGITTVGMKDFVVRRNVFKCMNKHHQLENVDAEMIVTSRIGKDRVIPFSAGYCKDCKIYYIIESTYEHLKRFGILNCRLTDEKSYSQALSSNGMLLAQESILMQYGYTVSKEFDLMEITRHKILANLIDNKIMTKNEIISYLDFFISQHNNPKYQMAVGKWEIDRAFARDYKVGKYTKYGVGGIRR